LVDDTPQAVVVDPQDTVAELLAKHQPKGPVAAMFGGIGHASGVVKKSGVSLGARRGTIGSISVQHVALTGQ
jgi:hypothetical protein